MPLKDADEMAFLGGKQSRPFRELCTTQMPLKDADEMAFFGGANKADPLGSYTLHKCL